GGTPKPLGARGAEGFVPLVADLRLLQRAPEKQRRAERALRGPDVGDDAPRERTALRDVGGGAGVERARADVDVAQRDRAAVVASLAGQLDELGAAAVVLAAALDGAREVEAAQCPVRHREVAIQPARRGKPARIGGAHRELA